MSARRPSLGSPEGDAVAKRLAQQMRTDAELQQELLRDMTAYHQSLVSIAETSENLSQSIGKLAMSTMTTHNFINEVRIEEGKMAPNEEFEQKYRQLSLAMQQIVKFQKLVSVAQFELASNITLEFLRPLQANLDLFKPVAVSWEKEYERDMKQLHNEIRAKEAQTAKLGRKGSKNKDMPELQMALQELSVLVTNYEMARTQRIRDSLELDRRQQTTMAHYLQRVLKAQAQCYKHVYHQERDRGGVAGATRQVAPEQAQRLPPSQLKRKGSAPELTVRPAPTSSSSSTTSNPTNPIVSPQLSSPLNKLHIHEAQPHSQNIHQGSRQSESRPPLIVGHPRPNPKRVSPQQPPPFQHQQHNAVPLSQLPVDLRASGSLTGHSSFQPPHQFLPVEHSNSDWNGVQPNPTLGTNPQPMHMKNYAHSISDPIPPTQSQYSGDSFGYSPEPSPPFQPPQQTFQPIRAAPQPHVTTNHNVPHPVITSPANQTPPRLPTKSPSATVKPQLSLKHVHGEDAHPSQPRHEESVRQSQQPRSGSKKPPHPNAIPLIRPPSPSPDDWTDTRGDEEPMPMQGGDDENEALENMSIAESEDEPPVNADEDTFAPRQHKLPAVPLPKDPHRKTMVAPKGADLQQVLVVVEENFASGGTSGSSLSRDDILDGYVHGDGEEDDVEVMHGGGTAGSKDKNLLRASGQHRRDTASPWRQTMAAPVRVPLASSSSQPQHKPTANQRRSTMHFRQSHANPDANAMENMDVDWNDVDATSHELVHVLYDFLGENVDDLSVMEGDVLRRVAVEGDWLYALLMEPKTSQADGSVHEYEPAVIDGSYHVGWLPLAYTDKLVVSTPSLSP